MRCTLIRLPSTTGNHHWIESVSEMSLIWTSVMMEGTERDTKTKRIEMNVGEIVRKEDARIALAGMMTDSVMSVTDGATRGLETLNLSFLTRIPMLVFYFYR
jgi:hypothetical protein